MNSRLKVCVALSALALSAMLPAAAERGADGFLDRAERCTAGGSPEFSRGCDVVESVAGVGAASGER